MYQWACCRRWDSEKTRLDIMNSANKFLKRLVIEHDPVGTGCK
jgi:hypothetical protein